MPTLSHPLSQLTLVATLLGLALGPSAPAAIPPPPGLTVRDGAFYHQGRPFRGIGINYFDAFLRLLSPHQGPHQRWADSAWRQGFATIKAYEIPFVRLPINGYYPRDWDLYRNDRPAFFARLDALVREAERLELGLVPSLFWNFYTLPDLMGEPFNRWGQADSRTRAAMRTFTREVVERYRGSPAIWAWEFGNEYLIEADHPAPEKGFGEILPHVGTPYTRPPADKVHSADVLAAYVDFARTVRALDATRPILTGDTFPRVSAWHLARGQGWIMDTEAQWTEHFKACNPDPVNTCSGHFYYYDPAAPGAAAAATTPATPPLAEQHVGFDGLGLREQLRLTLRVAREAGKPLFVGEFGAAPEGEPGPQSRRQFTAVLEALLAERVPVSAVWVYDRPSQPQFSVTPTGANAYILEALRDTNRRLRQPE